MISVIIPMYNEEMVIEQTLKELKSIPGDFEILVIDGESTDRSVEIASRSARVESGPKCRAVQMNQGVELAKGDILVFLHADTQLPEQAMTEIEKVMEDPSVIGGRFRFGFSDRKRSYWIVESFINARDSLTKGFAGDQAIFMSKKAFDDLGGYKEIPVTEDLDMARRMKKYGQIARIPIPIKTSPRRWRKTGFVKAALMMRFLRILYLLQVSPKTIRKFYDDVR